MTRRSSRGLRSDHGHLDIERVVSLNRFFQDHGLQRADETGRVLEYDAYCHSGSLSAQIYLREDRPELFQTVWSLLWDNRELLGIRELLTKDVCRQRYHTDGGYAFMAAELDGRLSSPPCPISRSSPPRTTRITVPAGRLTGISPSAAPSRSLPCATHSPHPGFFGSRTNRG